MNDFGLDLAVIGNGRSAALLDPTARIVWWCYPRFDGDPVFSRLLAGGEEKGFCDVLLEGMVDFSSEYLRNTAVVSTVLTDGKGASIRITDFAPRFREYDRIFRPPQLMRIIEPVAGLPRITQPAVLICRDVFDRWVPGCEVLISIAPITLGFPKGNRQWVAN
jgi:hypothetical protein